MVLPTVALVLVGLNLLLLRRPEDRPLVPALVAALPARGVHLVRRGARRVESALGWGRRSGGGRSPRD